MDQQAPATQEQPLPGEEDIALLLSRLTNVMQSINDAMVQFAQMIAPHFKILVDSMAKLQSALDANSEATEELTETLYEIIPDPSELSDEEDDDGDAAGSVGASEV